jgi:EmrB/QacA subfamily drug resistance transporter
MAIQMAASTTTADTMPLRSGERAPSTAARPQKAPANLRVVLPVLLAATFMQLLDTTIVNVALPDIKAQLGATAGQLQLVVAGYQLAFACLLLVGGRLGDLFGRRRTFLLGMAAFVLASVACALATTGWQLVGTRLVQGAASGLMFPQVLSILQVSVPVERRAKAFGLYGATVGLATVLGPVLGGVLLDPLALGWSSIFWVNVPVGLVALAIGFTHLPESRPPHARRFDVLSVPLVTGGLFLILLPLVIGRDEGWPWWSFAAMALAVPVLAAFAWRQRRLDPERDGADTRPAALASPVLFRSPVFRLGLLLNAVFFAGISPFFFVFILSLQTGLGRAALVAGLTIIPFAIAGTITSSVSGRVAAKLGPWVLVVGCALLLIGHAGIIATLHLAGPDLAVMAFAPALVVAGLGFGLFVAPVSQMVLSGIDGRDAGSASGLLATVQQVGGAAGVAAIGVIFFGLLGDRPDRAHFVDSLEQSLHWELGVFALSTVLAVLLARLVRKPARAATAVPTRHTSSQGASA